MSVSRCAGRRGDVDLMRAHAIELARMAPDLILVHGGRALTAVQREMHDIPIVFAGVSDPVSDGIVASLARPTFRLVR